MIPQYQSLPSSSTLTKRDAHPYAHDAVTNDAYFGSMEDIINLPVTSNNEHSIVTGDKNHMQHFVSLSDGDEKTGNTNKAPYRLRDRKAKRRKDKFSKKPYAHESDSE